MEYDNTNRISLWRNERKRPDKRDPDLQGTINVEGKEYWISLWKRGDKASDKAPVLSGSISPKEEAHNPQPSQPPADDFDDSIPF